MLNVECLEGLGIAVGTKCKEFRPIGEKVGNMSVYKDLSKKLINILYENEDKIVEIGMRYDVNLVVLASNSFFKFLVKNTDEQEMDINLFVSKNRKIIHFAVFGIEPRILLVALDD